MKPEYKVHPAAEIFPMMGEEDFARLKADIDEFGQREPIVLLDGKIIDGRNRHKACVELGRETDDCELEQCDDPVGYVLSANLHRRHLSIGQRTMTAARLLLATDQDGVQICTRAAEDIASEFGISRRSVFHGMTVARDGCEDLVALCDDDTLAVSLGAEFVKHRWEKEVQEKCLRSIFRYAESPDEKARILRSLLKGEQKERKGNVEPDDDENTEAQSPTQVNADLLEVPPAYIHRARAVMDTDSAAYAKAKAGELELEEAQRECGAVCPNCGHHDVDDDGDCLGCREPWARPRAQPQESFSYCIIHPEERGALDGWTCPKCDARAAPPADDPPELPQALVLCDQCTTKKRKKLCLRCASRKHAAEVLFTPLAETYAGWKSDEPVREALMAVVGDLLDAWLARRGGAE